ncbi:uncharacterized protein MELLADRAFT_69366 [Melampsora larici-populina 98AG31]|uniref:Uncharacterized protein n=1 Tax=Melampsora larici-populina (strain 98AG31 / pathotype 3-4-7) TaxID=747676 RepID=F4SAG1_MELLP|nr:uncharacterized protein MELLADRAFT_69366 [Melampsora larici-populina 98AG31]EGF98382.1 hypothetical protein MELLADRAFT_69366 [Melampsora larici-populina 98AG31]
MRSWRFGIRYLHASALIICTIPFIRSFTNPEDVIDIKMVESSDQETKALSQQDGKHLMKIHDQEIDQVLAPVDEDTGAETSTSTNYLLSAYAPEFGPSKASNPRNTPKIQHSASQQFGSNHPHGIIMILNDA